MSDTEVDLLEEVSDLIKQTEKYAEATAAQHSATIGEKLTEKINENREKTDGIIMGLDKKVEQLGQRVVFLENENRTLKKALSDLSSRLSANRNCPCQGLFCTIVEAGHTYLQSANVNDTEPTPRAPETCTSPLQTGTTSTLDLRDTDGTEFLTYTVQTTPDNVQTPVQPSKSNHSPAMTAFTTLMTPSATSQIYTSIDEVPEPLRSDIVPFNSPRSNHANNDKLSDLQRAYFKLKMGKYDHVERIGKRGDMVFQDGLSDHIWARDKESYIKMRVKNCMNGQKLKKMKASQSERQKDLTK